MRAFMFQSAKDFDVLGFTEDETGRNLPVELAPWRVRGGRALPIGEEADAVVAALKTKGYYLVRSSVIADLPVQHWWSRHTDGPRS